MNTDFDKIDILLVEDDHSQNELMSFILNKIGINKIRVATNYQEAITEYNKKVPDIALVDIILPNSKSGIEVAKYINNKTKIPIIFITCNYIDQIYQEAKLVKPYAFINKEISELKIRQIIELAMQYPLPMKEVDFAGSNIKTSLDHNFFMAPCSSHFFVRIGNNLKKINLVDILYFEVEEKYTMVVLKDKRIPSRIPLKEMAKRLKDQHFTRIHKSYMININKVELIDTIKNELLLNGKKLPLGRSFKSKLLKEISVM